MKLFKLSTVLIFVLCVISFVTAADDKASKPKKAATQKTSKTDSTESPLLKVQAVLSSIYEESGLGFMTKYVQDQYTSMKKNGVYKYACKDGFFTLENAMTVMVIIHLCYLTFWLMQYEGCVYLDAIAKVKQMTAKSGSADDEPQRSVRSSSATPQQMKKKTGRTPKKAKKTSLLMDEVMESPALNTRSRSVSVAPSSNNDEYNEARLKKMKVADLEALMDSLKIKYQKGSKELKADKITKILEVLNTD